MTRQYHLAKFSDKPAGKLKVCQYFKDRADLVQIILFQRGIDRFAVQYGMQVDDDLSYGEACAKLGQALMHDLSCGGLVDNRQKGER